MTCPTFLPPKYGSVLLPCIELFGSSCFTKCGKGYSLSGNQTSKCIVSSGVAKWAPNNAVCKGIDSILKFFIFQYNCKNCFA